LHQLPSAPVLTDLICSTPAFQALWQVFGSARLVSLNPTLIVLLALSALSKTFQLWTDIGHVLAAKTQTTQVSTGVSTAATPTS
jgi:hypothetical protein